MPLTGKQRHHLRGLAHHLDPLVQLGHEGLSEAVVVHINEALAAHELIKVRVGSECPIDRHAAAEAIAAATRSDIAQIIGRVLVVYRRRPQKPKVDLPTKGALEREGKPKGSKSRHPKRTRPSKSRKPRKSHAPRGARGPARGADDKPEALLASAAPPAPRSPRAFGRIDRPRRPGPPSPRAPERSARPGGAGIADGAGRPRGARPGPRVVRPRRR